ncbi:MAG: XRE family transcriptional regulator [Eubacteriales bacterium]|nr:XRE family transcriptional regulator [Eubacteriales bacterium]
MQLSEIFEVTTDYLLKDKIEEITYADSSETQRDGIRLVTLEEANVYMDTVKQLAGKIAAGVMLCIVSPVCLIQLAAIAEMEGVLKENIASGIGAAICLALIAVGVSLFLIYGMKLGKFDYLEKEILKLSYGVEGLVEKKKSDYESVFRTGITAGVVLCITSVIPFLLTAGFTENEMYIAAAVNVLLLMVATGVYLIVRVCMVKDSFSKLLQAEDYTAEKKKIARKTETIAGVYWCIVTAVYLGISFYTFRWDTTWAVWPVAALIFAAVMGVAKIMLGKAADR